MTNPLENPLSALRTYIDLKDKALVSSIFDECEAAGLYINELGDDPGVWIYRWEESKRKGSVEKNLFYINDNKDSGPLLAIENVDKTGNLIWLEWELLNYLQDEGLTPPGFEPDYPSKCPTSINCKKDINDFVYWLFNIADVAYHWDTPASEYVDAAGQQLFWPPQVCRAIDTLTRQALTLEGMYFENACIQCQEDRFKD